MIYEREAASPDSSSMGHNSNEQRELPFRLTGSQRKTAFALEVNVANLIAEAGIERVGFLTLTVGDLVGGEFRQVWCALEASRRINSLATGLLKDLFLRWVIVTERHKSGAIHFHLVVETRGDIRGDFDFGRFLDARTARKEGRADRQAEIDYISSATEHLRALWGILRERLPGYGFGRAELTPVYKSGEAISRYVSKYVEKNLFNRVAADRGKKLVRYGGWKKRSDGSGSHLKPNEFGWATPKACEWRRKVMAIAACDGVETAKQMKEAIGPRWAWRVHESMRSLGLEAVKCEEGEFWSEGMMTRNQVELSREWMQRDRASQGSSRRKGCAPDLWDRPLTAGELAKLNADLEDARVDQLARGFTFEEFVECEAETESKHENRKVDERSSG